MKSRTVSAVVMAAAFAIYGTFLFANLGDRALWDDEAQTAILARHVLKYALPYFPSVDNRPTDRIEMDDFNGSGVFIWNTWFPYYLNAASFSIFGESEFAARFPFAVFSLLTFWLYVRLCAKLFPSQPFIRLTAIALLLFSAPFLLHMRQARYYSLITFGTLWMTWGYLLLANGRRRGIIHMAAAGILTFNSFHVIAFINLAGFWIYTLWKKRSLILIKQLSFSTIVIVAAAIPFLIYMQPWAHPPDPAFDPFSTKRVVRSLWIYLLWLNGFVLPFAVPVATASFAAGGRGLLPALAAYLIFLVGAPFTGVEIQVVTFVLFAVAITITFFRLRASSREKHELSIGEDNENYNTFAGIALVLTPLYVLALAFLSPHPSFRYVTPLIPLVLPLGAVLIGRIAERYRPLGIAVLLLLLCSNLLSASPLKMSALIAPSNVNDEGEYFWGWIPLRSDISSFLYEITHHVADPEETIVEYLRGTGSDGEKVKASYGTISLMYYLPRMNIIPRRSSRGGVPDYIIVRDPYPLTIDSEFLNKVGGVEYRAVHTKAPDVCWANDPDPWSHRYKKDETLPRLIIYRRSYGRTTERTYGFSIW